MLAYRGSVGRTTTRFPQGEALSQLETMSTASELAMLLDGIDLRSVKRGKRFAVTGNP